MEKTKISISIIFNLIILAFFSQAVCAVKVDYVSVSAGSGHTWKYTINKDLFEDYLDDFGFDSDDFDLNTEGIKIKILEVDEQEKEYDIGGRKFKGVEMETEIYYTNDFRNENAWTQDKDQDSSVIFEFDDDLYSVLIIMVVSLATPHYIAKDIDWVEVADEINRFDGYFDDIDDIKAEKKGNGIHCTIKWSKDFYGNSVKEEEFFIKYTRFGVCESIRHLYGGEQFFFSHLFTLVPGYPLAPFVLILGIGIFGVIILLLNKKELKNP